MLSFVPSLQGFKKKPVVLPYLPIYHNLKTCVRRCWVVPLMVFSRNLWRQMWTRMLGWTRLRFLSRSPHLQLFCGISVEKSRLCYAGWPHTIIHMLHPVPSRTTAGLTSEMMPVQPRQNAENRINQYHAVQASVPALQEMERGISAIIKSKEMKGYLDEHGAW